MDGFSTLVGSGVISALVSSTSAFVSGSAAAGAASGADLASSPGVGFLGAGLGEPLPKMAFSMPKMGASKAKVAKIEAVRVMPKSCHQRRICQ